MAKITFKKLWGYQIFGIGSISVKGEDHVVINGVAYNINDLGVGPINWLIRYAINTENILSFPVYQMLKKNGIFDIK